MAGARGFVSRLMQSLFGSVHWQPPSWGVALAAWSRRHETGLKRAGAVLLLLLLAVWGGYRYWQSLPQPALTYAEAIAPALTIVGEDEKLYPQPLQLRFRTHYPNPTDEGPRNAAQLALLGEEIQGIRLQPAHPGKWRWDNENTLIFTTEQDWPAGQTYQVMLSEEIFAEGIRLASGSVEFRTPSFSMSLDKLAFYQDPEQPSRHQTVATLQFSHAVDLDSLRRLASFTMRPSGAPVTAPANSYPYTVTLGRAGREAYLSTDPLTLPEQENFMLLKVDAGVKPVLGADKAAETIEQSVRIPSVNTYFRVSSLGAEIIRNEEDEPEQTLVLEMTDGVRTETVMKTLQAWELPADYHRSGVEVPADVMKRATPVTLSGNPSEFEFSQLHSFRFRANQGRRLLVRLPAGLESRGGFRMTVPYETIIYVPRFPQEMNIVGEGGLLSLSGERQLGFQTRGVHGIEVEVHQLFEDQIVHLVSQTYGRMRDASFAGGMFGELNISKKHTRKVMIAEKDPAKAAYASLDLSPWLKDPASNRGVFVVNAYGLNENGYRAGPSDRRLLLVSDLALISKRDAGNAHTVYVLSLASETPVAAATISLLGRNGRVLLSRSSDQQGRAQFPDVSDYKADQQPVAWLVKHGSDLAFMPFASHDRTVNYSRFDVGGVHTGRSDGTSTVRAMVFSDRGIYRPGEQGHLAVMSKRDDWKALPASPIEVIVTDPRGNQLLSQRQRLAPEGLQEVDFALAATAPTGQYQVAINLITDERNRHWTQIGSGTFSVEEFQPDTLRIRTRFEDAAATGWHTSLKLTGKVSLENLFGAAAEDRRVRASYTLAPTRFSFEGFDGFSFDNPYRDQKDTLQRHVTETLPEARTDREGQASFALDLSGYGNGLYQLSFEAEGFDSGGGRSVQARSRILLSPLTLLLGSKADGDLAYLRRDTERNIRFIAIDPSLNSVATDDLTLRLTEVQSLSTLVRQRDGTLAYQTIEKKVPMSETPFSVEAKGSSWRVPTDKAGDFIVELVNGDGLVMALRQFSVIGSRNLAGNLEKNAELELKLNRSDYQAGDMIEMQITAPYTGMGLITIERNKVFAQKWFRADSQRTVETIRVPEGIEGNAYVNVTFVRSLDSEEIFTQPLSVAVQPFSVDRQKRNIAMTLATPEKVAPGQVLSIEVEAAAAGKMVVFAVDEGILQVAGYRTPAPLDTFLRKRALEVTTQQIADMLLPEFSLLQRAAAGGDAPAAEKRAMADMLGQNLNPFQRNVRAPVVFWSGVISATGKKQVVDFKVPDYFDGQLRIMAVASNNSSVGAGSTSTLVRDAFVLSPNVITTAAPGDEFEVSVGIANTLDAEDGEQTLTVEAIPDMHLALVDAAPQTLTLAPGREGRISFRVRATDQVGAAELGFRVFNDRYDVRRSATLSVRPAVPYRVSLQSGIVDSDEQLLPLSRKLLAPLAEQQVVAGYSPTVLTRGLERYLHHYPHACSEQIVSRVFPALALMKDPGSGIDRERIQEQIAGVASTLSTRQSPQGGYSFWPGGHYVDDAVSVYALHFLLEAREQGQPVNANQLSKAEDYLRSIAGATPGQQRAETQAYAIYVLTRSGQVTTNYLTLLQTYLEKQDPKHWRRSLAAAWMAASYRQLKLEELATSLIGQYKFAEVTQQYDWPLDSALLRNAQYLYLLAKHFPERLSNVSDEVIATLALPVSKGQFNTLSASWTILALSAWGEQAAQLQPGALTIMTQIGEAAMETLASSQPGAIRVEADVPLSVQRLALQGDASQRFFYSLSQSGFDVELPSKAIQNGIEIHRRYLDADGKDIDTAMLGDELTVRISLRSVDGMTHNNVAVVDLLPGGFEVLRDSVRGQGQGWQTDYVDIREDRLVLYGAVSSQVRQFEYRVKLTGQGQFVVPPAFAESMYHRHVHGQALAGQFVVTPPAQP